jgi:DNA replication protein DnaC
VHELIEAADDRRLQRIQKNLAAQELLVIDELGFVPLSKTGAELLVEVISQRYERGSIIITTNLPELAPVSTGHSGIAMEARAYA